MLHFKHFLSARHDPALQSSITSLPDLPRSLQHCLVVGPPRSGKTAVLFHFAYSIAAQGHDVIFICKRQSVEFEPPVLPIGVSKEDAALTRIHMRYLNTLSDVKQLAASVHLLQRPPAALIVDGLSQLETTAVDRQQQDSLITATLSYLHDATLWAGQQQASGHCFLVVSDVTSTEVPRNLYLYRRWLPCVLQITTDAGTCGLSLERAVFEYHEVAHQNGATLGFSIAKHNALALEAVVPAS